MRFSRETSLLASAYNVVTWSYKDIGVIHRSLQPSLAGDLQLGRWGEVQQGTSLSWPWHIMSLHGPSKDIGVIHRRLQHSLASNLQLGLWDEVQQTDFFVLASAYNVVTWSYKDIGVIHRSLQHSLAGDL